MASYVEVNKSSLLIRNENLLKKKMRSKLLPRGEIKRFSRSSQKRLARLLLNNAEKFKLFFTVTYGINQRDCLLSKKHIDYFLTRFRKACGSAIGYVWALEFQKRGAVHFHLWFEDFDPPELNECRNLVMRKQIQIRFKDSLINLKRFKFLTHLWLRVTGQLDNEKVVKASTDLKIIESSNFIVSYAIKYAWKAEQKEFQKVDFKTGEKFSDWVGRFWGASRSIKNDKLYDSLNVKTVRIIRKWLARAYGKKKISGMWLVLDHKLKERLSILCNHLESLGLSKDDDLAIRRLEEFAHALQSVESYKIFGVLDGRF